MSLPIEGSIQYGKKAPLIKSNRAVYSGVIPIAFMLAEVLALVSMGVGLCPQQPSMATLSRSLSLSFAVPISR